MVKDERFNDLILTKVSFCPGIYSYYEILYGFDGLGSIGIPYVRVEAGSESVS
jgi:hypothetical protein